MKRILLYFFVAVFLFACSKDEAIEMEKAENQSAADDEAIVGERYTAVERQNLFQLNFIPTFSNFYSKDYGSSTYRSSTRNGEWEHQFDEDGRLSKSVFYENKPHRVLKEINFLDYDEGNLTVDFEEKTYTYLYPRGPYMDTTRIIFDEDYNIKRIGFPEDGISLHTVFEEFTDENWVSLINSGAYKTGYVYDEQGRIIEYSGYTPSGEWTSTVEYTYNENGDLKTYYFHNDQGDASEAELFYRDNSTLERLEGTFDYGGDNAGTELFTYTEEEGYIKGITNYDDNTRDESLYEEDKLIKEHYEANGNLTIREIYHFDGEYYKPQLSEHYTEGILDHIEYYDENGELSYTEYYDENGEVTNTEDA